MRRLPFNVHLFCARHCNECSTYIIITISLSTNAQRYHRDDGKKLRLSGQRRVSSGYGNS